MAKILESFDDLGEQIGSFFADPEDPYETMQFTLFDTQSPNPAPFRISDPDALRALFEFLDQCLDALEGYWPEEETEPEGKGLCIEVGSRRKRCDIQVANGTMTAEAIDKLLEEASKKERMES